MQISADKALKAANAANVGSSPAWVVLKFGGTSVSKKTRWDTIAALVKRELASRRVLVVVSALSGVTDKLKQLAELIHTSATAESIVKAIAEKHFELLAELHASAPIPDCKIALDSLCEMLLTHAAQRPSATDSALYAWQAELLSVGELLSSTLGAHYLKALGLPIAWLDARLHLKASVRANDTAWAQYLSAQCASKPDSTMQHSLAERSPAARLTQIDYVLRKAIPDLELQAALKAR